jgi:hypothetical protein
MFPYRRLEGARVLPSTLVSSLRRLVTAVVASTEEVASTARRDLAGALADIARALDTDSVHETLQPYRRAVDDEMSR